MGEGLGKTHFLRESQKGGDACDLAYVVDVSQSMDRPQFKMIRKAMESLAGTMVPGEKGALVGYKTSACKLYQGLTGKKKALQKAMEQMAPEKKTDKAAPGVTEEGIRKGIAQLKKGKASNGRMLFVIGDADITFDAGLVKQAKKQHIQIFAVNASKKKKLPQLQKYASETGGFYYSLSNMKYLQGLLFDMKHVVLDGISTADRDGDGLFDAYEKKGMRFFNGKVIKTNPKKKDTDGDKLTDREEMGYPVWVKKEDADGDGIGSYKTCYAGASYPVGKDTDWDGLTDAKDASPENNKQSATLVRKDGSKPYSYPLSYQVDLQWFLKPKQKYNKKLARLSAIMAGLAYYAPYDKKASYYKIKVKAEKDDAKPTTCNLEQYMDKLGFFDAKRCYLGDKYKDNHLLQFNYGYQKLGDRDLYLLPIFIRGTSGKEEWISNFDIGKSGMHKGFNTAANRVLEEINSYIFKHNLDRNNTVIWITGHSRGGGVSNLVAKKMIDRGFQVFSYTFAAPSVVEDKIAEGGKYNSIFNIINKDDFVPCLPLSKWGFSLYGKYKKSSLTKKMKESFQNKVGKKYKALSKKGLKKLVGSLEKVSDTRSGCFQYTCKCHSKDGKKTGKSITVTSKFYLTKKRAASALDKYKKKLLKEQASSCKFKKVKVLKLWRYKVCQSPMFFLFCLAEAMSSPINFVFKDVAKRYEDAKFKLVTKSEGVKKPHFVDAYILLTN